MVISNGIDRRFPETVKKLAGGVLGVCSLLLMAAAFVGVDPGRRAKGDSAEPANPAADKPQEAAAGFDDMTNGYEEQGDFDEDKDSFDEPETILPDKKTGQGGGLGPVYNATSCAACHQAPVSGSASQIVEIRAGQRKPDPSDPSRRKVRFVEPLGGSVMHQRAIDASIQEHMLPEYGVRTFRLSTNILGNGFVEVIPDEKLLEIKQEQRRHGMQGFAVVVPVAIEMKPVPGGNPTPVLVERIGRFGWKCQEASLLNFSAGAYIVEMGITSPMQLKENLSNGQDMSEFDKVCDPEDHVVEKDDPKKKEFPFGHDVEAFTRFLRSTKAPPRDSKRAGTERARQGEKLFETLGCAICHYPSYTTPAAGTPIQTLGKRCGSDMGTVPEALGNKIIHPYSDFLLHDIGTGDGIAQTQHADLPPRGIEDLQKIPEGIKKRYDILRVEANPERGAQRVLEVSPGEEDARLDQRTVNKIRTAPLWGLRVRPQLMHDGLSFTIDDAIRRHKGQAEGVELKYEVLPDEQKEQLIAFLNSL